MMMVVVVTRPRRAAQGQGRGAAAAGLALEPADDARLPYVELQAVVATHTAALGRFTFSWELQLNSS